MQKILVSLFIRNGMYAIIISENGVVKDKYVKKLREPDKNKYLVMIEVFNCALRRLKVFIQDSMADNVVFETSNSILMKWIEAKYSKKEYEKEFHSLMLELDQIPICYTMLFNKKPLAALYLDEKYIEKPKLSGLDL